jgi:valyl-tRNA synthetase
VVSATKRSWSATTTFWIPGSAPAFAALGWPDRTVDLERYYPTDLLVTGPDTLVPWVSRSLMMGLLFTSEVPFRRVLITPLVKDERGQKMSKGRGTAVNPLNVLERYGTDAVRFSLAEQALPAADAVVDGRELARSQRLATRIWNGARFVATCGDARLDLSRLQVEGASDSLGLAHRWILSRSSRVATEVGSSIEQLRIDRAAEALRVFLEELLGDYLEMVRLLSKGKKDPTAHGVVRTVFDRALRLLHPFMPFITEAIWQSLPHDGDSICIAPFPEAEPQWESSEAEAEMSSLRSVVDAVRRLRSEYNVEATRHVEVILTSEDPENEMLLRHHRDLVTALGRIGELTMGEAGSERPGVVRETAGQVRVALVLAEGFDRDAEIGRLSRDVGKMERELEALAKKLSNEDFTSKATPEVVRATQDKYADLQKKKQKIEEGLRALRQ